MSISPGSTPISSAKTPLSPRRNRVESEIHHKFLIPRIKQTLAKMVKGQKLRMIPSAKEILGVRLDNQY